MTSPAKDAYARTMKVIEEQFAAMPDARDKRDFCGALFDVLIPDYRAFRRAAETTASRLSLHHETTAPTP
jgi:hypothetical protein